MQHTSTNAQAHTCVYMYNVLITTNNIIFYLTVTDCFTARIPKCTSVWMDQARLCWGVAVRKQYTGSELIPTVNYITVNQQCMQNYSASLMLAM